MSKERMIAFTDAVLAIIMTILVLELEKPTEISWAGFWELRRSFFSYLLSFFWLGTMWVTQNRIWENVKKVTGRVIRWNLILLFCASFIPYVTGIVSSNFTNPTAQAAYGLVIIAVSICNLLIHKFIDAPNSDNSELLDATKNYRRIIIIDICIKIVCLILALTVYPQIMMYGVLFCGLFIQVSKIILLRKRSKQETPSEEQRAEE